MTAKHPIAGLLMVLAAVSAALAGPKAVVQQSEVHLGTLVRGEDGEASFAVRNTGDTPLTIDVQPPGCDCTLADYDREIAPGAVGHVRATLLTGLLNGQVGKGLTLRTNDPAHASVRLALRADIVSHVQALPQDAIFVRGRGGRVLLRKAPGVAGELVVGAPESSVSWLTARATRLDVSRRRGQGLPVGVPGDWILEIVPADGAHGTAQGTVEFATGLASQPRMKLLIRANVAPAAGD